MVLVDFTTYGDIRAALGVSTDEIEDTTLALDVYLFNLMAEFDDMEASPLEAYEAIRETDPEQMDPAELRLFRATRVFSTYAVAKQLLVSLPMFGPKEISDGKASVTRFSGDPYKETTKRVETQYERALARLASALAALQASTREPTPLRTYFLGVASGSDPVTGT